jgi:hypothetical protein
VVTDSNGDEVSLLNAIEKAAVQKTLKHHRFLGRYNYLFYISSSEVISFKVLPLITLFLFSAADGYTKIDGIMEYIGKNDY